MWHSRGDKGGATVVSGWNAEKWQKCTKYMATKKTDDDIFYFSERLELPDVYARDFAYPEGTSLHYGIIDQKQHHQQRRDSQVSLSSPDFTGCQARALYDFVPETEYEIGMNEGDIVWVQYRQCPVSGWISDGYSSKLRSHKIHCLGLARR